MKFELKDMYSFLISHTFPGLLVLVEILLFYQWFVNPHFWEFLQQNWPTETGIIIVLLILAYAFSTLLGIILDGIHHFIFEDFLRQKSKEDKFGAIKDNLSMEVYKHFLEDDLWYPYEAYANVGLALVPGLGLFCYWLSSILHLEGWRFWLPLFLYVIILAMTFAEAIYTYSGFIRDEEEFIKVYLARQAPNPTKGSLIFETEVVQGPDENILNDIILVNRGSFPPGWVYSDAKKYYKDMLRKEVSINIMLKDKEKRIGYLLAIPYNDAVRELKKDDPEMEEDPMKYYIETAAILPEYRGKKGFSKMLERLIEECKKRGITKISLHARVNAGLSAIMQRKFKITEVRRIERWPYYNSEEPTDYIEAILAPDKVEIAQS